MSIFHKKKEELLAPTIDVSNILKLAYVQITVGLKPYYTNARFEAKAQYYEHPENDYKSRGTEHSMQITRDSWPELKAAVDELLGITPTHPHQAKEGE